MVSCTLHVGSEEESGIVAMLGFVIETVLDFHSKTSAFAHLAGGRRMLVKARVESVKPVLMSSDVPASIRFYERLGFTLNFQDDPASPKICRC